MAPKSLWRGYLKLSLVTCPVAMLPATSGSEKVSFHTLKRATGNRVESPIGALLCGQRANQLANCHEILPALKLLEIEHELVQFGRGRGLLLQTFEKVVGRGIQRVRDLEQQAGRNTLCAPLVPADLLLKQPDRCAELLRSQAEQLSTLANAPPDKSINRGVAHFDRLAAQGI
jgi:hypothetical protein